MIYPFLLVSAVSQIIDIQIIPLHSPLMGLANAIFYRVRLYNMMLTVAKFPEKKYQSHLKCASMTNLQW